MIYGAVGGKHRLSTRSACRRYPPNQQIRELTQNAIEEIQRRWATSDDTPGVIHWDVDWTHLEHEAEFKLAISDNGDGMTVSLIT